MLLSDIDFTTLEKKTSEDRWGAGTARDRLIYRDADLWYKTWGPEYLKKSCYAAGGQFHGVESHNQPHGFEVGLFTPDISCAFVEFIHDETGAIRGYVSKTGEHPDVVPSDFIHSVFRACLRVGWVFSDLGSKNIILTDRGLSLIDFDTHLVSLNDFDIPFEERTGTLRPHVLPLFSKLVLDHVKAGRSNLSGSSAPASGGPYPG